MAARPQLENGHLRIANELIEALARIRVPGEARQVFDAIIRKTYGFNKKTDRIALSQLSLATGLKRPTVCKAVRKLLDMNLITKKGNGTVVSYGINKDFDTWKPLPKRARVPKKEMGVSKKGKKRYPKGHTQKTKDTSSKDTTPFPSDSVEYRLSAKLISIVTERHPHIKRKDHDPQKWARDIDLLMRIDKAPPEEIAKVIDFISHDYGNGRGDWKGWGGVVQSAVGLRRNYTKVLSAMESAGPNAASATDVRGDVLPDLGDGDAEMEMT